MSGTSRERGARPRVEVLEGRPLLAAVTGTTINVPVEIATPGDPGADSTGDTVQVPTTPTSSGGFAEFSGGLASADGIAAGPDGNLWVANLGAGGDSSIVVIGPDGSVKATYPLAQYAGPEGITVGPDGALWFAESSGNKIGRITTDGQLTEYAVPWQEVSAPGFSGTFDVPPDPWVIVAGTDGALYFNWSGVGLGRITTDGTITQIPVDAAVGGIAATADGSIWFANDSGQGSIGRIAPDGTITQFVIPGFFSYPTDLQAGPDGALWFLETGKGQVGRIAPDGTITEYPLPSGTTGANGMTLGPDGNFWINAQETPGPGGLLIRMTTQGDETVFDVPGADGWAGAIANGPDGALWFLESSGALLVRADPSNLPAPDVDQPLTGGGLTFIGPFPPGQPIEFGGLVHNITGALASFRGGDIAATLADFSATIDWGDGTTSAGTLDQDPQGWYDVSGSHTFPATGSYQVVVTITETPGPNSPSGHTLTLDDLVTLTATQPPPIVTAPQPITVTPVTSPGQPTVVNPPSDVVYNPAPVITTEAAFPSPTTAPTSTPSVPNAPETLSAGPLGAFAAAHRKAVVVAQSQAHPKAPAGRVPSSSHAIHKAGAKAHHARRK